MWGGLGGALAAAGVAALTLSSAWSQNPDAPATAPGISPHCKASASTFTRPARPARGVLVPVIVHYMIVVASRPDGVEPPERREANDLVREHGRKIEAHFAPPTRSPNQRRWNVNDIWLPAGVQFHLLRTEMCQYLVEEVGSIPLPIPSPEDLAQFHRLNRTFNAPGFAGVDYYVWPSFTVSGGYGSPRVSDRRPVMPRPGAAWTNAALLKLQTPYPPAPPVTHPLPLDAVLLTAHELGHFLNLDHACDRSGRRRACGPPGSNGILMSFLADGTHLPPDEPERARDTLKRMGFN